jgi:TonB family protein
MECINQIVFPSIGTKSPIHDSSVRFMRRAYYTINFFIIFIIFVVLGLSQLNQRHILSLRPNIGKNVISISYAQLGPPPSIMGNDAITQSLSSTPTGVPKPVIDALAQQVTVPLDENKSLNAINENLTQSNIPIVSFSALDIKPQPINIPEPVYPEVVRKAHIEGEVLVKGLVDIDGKVIIVQIAQSSGNPLLDQSAMAAARNTQFKPAKQRDQFVRVWVSIPFKFNLNDEK